MNKKFLAKLLIFCMVFTMLPMAAFAATEETVDGTTYTIAFDTDATTVVAGGSASVRANVTYANGNDAEGITIAYTVSPEVKGVTVTKDGVVNATADAVVDTKFNVTASATIADKTIDITKELTVTAPKDVNVVNGVIAGTLNTDITTDNTQSIYKMGNDTVVIKVEDQATVTLASETVNSIAENTKGYKTVIVVTKNADIYLTKSVAEAIQRAYAGASDTTVTLSVVTTTVADVAAAYNVTFKVGDKEVMPANTTNAYLKLVVANPLAADATKVYVYHYADSKYYENGISGVRFTDETPKRVQFTASHFSTIVITAEAQKTEDEITYGGGGGGSTGNVSIATKVTGGKVTVTPTRPTRGQTVTINVTPNEGYKLDTLVVTDNKGNNVELTKVSDNKYTFVMPAGKVTVTPTFVKTDAKEETKDPAAVKRFSDVASGAWYAEYITYVTDNALMNGYDDGRFGPNDQTTRAQIVTVLYRLEGEPATRSSNSFSDVSSGGQYYSSAVAWAAINNIVNGYEDGRFGPNDNVTREQIAAILYRYATYKGYDTENAGSIANFSDAAKVSSWANTAISWAVGEELMNGDNGALRPQGNATRAEIAALLMRFAENIAK